MTLLLLFNFSKIVNNEQSYYFSVTILFNLVVDKNKPRISRLIIRMYYQLYSAGASDGLVKSGSTFLSAVFPDLGG